jgi:hypothetical protein
MHVAGFARIQMFQLRRIRILGESGYGKIASPSNQRSSRSQSTEMIADSKLTFLFAFALRFSNGFVLRFNRGPVDVIGGRQFLCFTALG